MFEQFQADFRLNFIDNDRYQMILRGLVATLEITAVALMIGVVIGVLVGAIRSTYEKNKDDMGRRKNLKYYILAVLNLICRLYLTVIRGTPMVVQLLICYLVIFASSTNSLGVAMLAFGINSGAYVAEIIRGGIMSIDEGQFEAGRSLGFNYVQTMRYVIVPQVIKNVLPTLFNEFIVLLKETSVAGYIGIEDLTKMGDLIRSRTFSAFMPLMAVALIYLVMVIGLTALDDRLEKYLRRNER
ncbi:MAG: amino acid ABC transporter permease [Lachnospiraceae bacterium]|nr:amino acid ABC transporter permease [Lachnospiraceae bacterium]